MSVQSEMNRISGNIADTYDELEALGATMPAVENSDNLASTAATIGSGLSGKEDKSNKVNTITGNESSTTYYPSTKAVADYHDSTKENISNKSDSYNPIYAWEKWSINTTYTDTLQYSGERYYGQYIDAAMMYGTRVHYCSNTNCTFDAENGRYVLTNASIFSPTATFRTIVSGEYTFCADNSAATGTTYATTIFRGTNSNGYTQGRLDNSSADFGYYRPMGNSSSYPFTWEVRSVGSSTSKGDIQYENVTSTSADAYPQNGAQDGYWYVSISNTFTYASTTALVNGLATKQGTLTAGDGIGISSDVVTNTDHALIPAQASVSNQLADKAFVNSSVQTATANFRGSWNTWTAVPTDSSEYPEDYAGSRIPTVNDYLVVIDASDYSGSQTLTGTWRFKYSGVWGTSGKDGWIPEYQVNETPMTAAQLAAINSGITSAKVSTYDGYATELGSRFQTGTDDPSSVANPGSLYSKISTGEEFIATKSNSSVTLTNLISLSDCTGTTSVTSYAGAEGTAAAIECPALTLNYITFRCTHTVTQGGRYYISIKSYPLYNSSGYMSSSGCRISYVSGGRSSVIEIGDYYKTIDGYATNIQIDANTIVQFYIYWEEEYQFHQTDYLLFYPCLIYLEDNSLNEKRIVGLEETTAISSISQNWRGLEFNNNKVTSLTPFSTNTQYPSAKVTYDTIHANKVKVQNTAPASPSVGDVWIDTSEAGMAMADITAAINTHNSDAVAHPSINRVSANPTVSSAAPSLTSLTVGSTDYKIGSSSEIISQLKELFYPVGAVVYSSNLDTMDKVIAAYGGTTWSKIEGKFILGASDTYPISSTGGEETHTLTIDEMPSHSHAWTRLSNSSTARNEGLTGAYNVTYEQAITSAILPNGGGQAHNNMPPYKAVYIWERTE